MALAARILGSYNSIPLESEMYICVYCLSVLYCVSSGIERADPPYNEFYQLSVK
jgi:hypothetical protein